LLRNGGTRPPRAAALVALLVVLILVALAAQTAAGKSLLRHAGLIGGREAYTALAFENPRNLPADLRGHPSLRVGFTLRNAEGGPRAYRWTIVSQTRRGTSRLASGITSAADGQLVRAGARIRIPCTGDRVRVNVRLADPAESIGFWTRCTRLPGAGATGG
jgi:Tfp pilus assembly protein PilX